MFKKIYKVTNKKQLLIFMIALFIVGCSSRSTIRPGDSLEVAFEKSMAQFENGRYGDAAQSFETVLSIGRGTQVANDAQYFLAESYYHNRQYLIAATEYRRYATNNPRSPRRAEVEYKEALSHYQMSPRYNLDQTDTYRAIELFQLFTRRYPDSEYAQAARDHIDGLRNKLAQKNFRAAELYLRTNRYEAAAIYFGLTMERYPESRWAERALAKQIESYVAYADNSIRARQEERYQKAVDTYYRYLQIFPRGENRSRAEEYYSQALGGLEQFVQASAE